MKDTTSQDSVRRYYERWGTRLGYRLVMKTSQHFGYYDKTHTTELLAQIRYHQRFAKLLDLKQDMAVLDAGCGQGVVAAYLAQHHDVAVTGITIVPHEVRSAQRLSRRKHVENRTHFLVADYAKPPFKPGTFDRIYTTETLSHAPDVDAVLQTFMKLLKPGGKLVCAEYECDYSKFTPEDHKLLSFVTEYGGLHGAMAFGPGIFLKRLKNTGFEQVTDIDWTPHIKPSFHRLRRLARPVRSVVTKLRLEEYFMNTHVASSYADWTDRGIFWYKIYSAAKKR